MSDRDLRVPVNDDRRSRERDHSVRWSVRVLFYGGGQVALFAFPILWLVYRASRYMALTRTGAAVALLAIPVVIGTLRAQRPGFPRLTTAMLATYRGNRAYLRRAALVNAAVVLAAYGGAGVGVVTATVSGVPLDAPVAVVAAAVVATGSPSLSCSGSPSRPRHRWAPRRSSSTARSRSPTWRSASAPTGCEPLPRTSVFVPAVLPCESPAPRIARCGLRAGVRSARSRGFCPRWAD